MLKNGQVLVAVHGFAKHLSQTASITTVVVTSEIPVSVMRSKVLQSVLDRRVQFQIGLAGRGACSLVSERSCVAIQLFPAEPTTYEGELVASIAL